MVIKITKFYAFSDESNYSNGDYKSIALIGIHENIIWEFENKLIKILSKYDISSHSFKWKNIRSKNKANALKELLDYMFPLMEEELIKIEVLIWNIYDKRHNIVGRNDSENLSYMYNKIIKDFAERNLNENDIMYLFPDQNSAVNWKELEEILYNQKIYSEEHIPMLEMVLERKKVIIKESSTEKEPIIQIADIFAGMGRSSFEDYNIYEHWLTPQQTLFKEIKKPTNRQKYRFPIYKIVDEWAKKNKMQISLKSKRGFFSHNPNTP